MMKLLVFFSLCNFISVIISESVKAQSIIDNIKANPKFSVLTNVLNSHGFESYLKLLSNPGTYTFFAPTNNAFASSSINTSKINETVVAIMEYHVLNNIRRNDELTVLQFLPTRLNNTRYTNLGDGVGQVLDVYQPHGSTDVFIYYRDNVAKVVKANDMCSNGIIHTIDNVILYPYLMSTLIQNLTDLTKLSEAIQRSGLHYSLDISTNLTFFAPNNAAIAKFGGFDHLSKQDLYQLIQHHMVSSSDVHYTPKIIDGLKIEALDGKDLTMTVSHDIHGQTIIIEKKSKIIQPNILTANGVIHIIDTVV